MLDILNKMHKF